MPGWPKSLPNRPANGTAQIEVQSAVAAFTPEIGPPMRRRRSTARIENMSGEFVLTSRDTQTLKTFFERTCKEGAVSFRGTDWLTGATRTFIFAEPPSYANISGRNTWRCTVKLIKLP